MLIKHKEKDMTNKDYITINRGGVFIGNKPATMYHGQPIIKLEQIKQTFKMPGLEEIIELRVLLSDTCNLVFESGNPTPSKTGPYVWIQAVTKYGVSPWIFRLSDIGRKDIASLCAFQCAWTIRQYPAWVNRLIDTAKAKAAISKTNDNKTNTYFEKNFGQFQK